MRYVVLFVGIVTCILNHAIGGDSAETQSPQAANAALQYWQAFSQLPPQSAENDKIYGELYTISLKDAAVQRLIASSHQSLLYLRRGAALPQCDWGLDYNDGMGLLLPHLAKSRDLARVGALRMRQNFEQANREAARDDAMATMILARHVGRDPIMICLLVRLAIEGMVVDSVAPYVPELRASYEQSKSAFDTLPKAVTLQETIAIEKQFMVRWMVSKLIEEEARKPGDSRDLWRGLLAGSEKELPEAVKSVDSIGTAIKMVEDLLPICDELSRFVAMPNDQFNAEYPAFKTKTKADNPLAGISLPAIDRVRANEQRNDARLAMLLAGIAVVESGSEKLKDLKDPFGSGPFEYRTLDKGFQLKSKLMFEGQPVTLTIGQAK